MREMVEGYDKMIDSSSHLSKKPHGEHGQARVLAAEPVVKGVEGEVVEVEELQPVPLRYLDGKKKPAFKAIHVLSHPCLTCVWQQMESYWSAIHTITMM